MTYALGGEAEHYQPKDPGPECLWCDGGGTVDVGSVIDVDGKSHSVPYGLAVEVPCPRCDGTGVEPRPEPEER